MSVANIASAFLFVSCCGWASVVVQNPTFIVPDVTGNYEYRVVGDVWSFTGSTGVAAVAGINNGFNIVSDPMGTQVGFIQAAPGLYGPPIISQTLTGLTVGDVYDVSFMSATRPNLGLPPLFWGGGEAFDVDWDSTVLGYYLPTLTTFSGYVTATFTATATTGVLSFAGIDPDGLDRTAFITNVGVSDLTPTPEPSSALMVVSALGMIGLGLSRKGRQ